MVSLTVPSLMWLAVSSLCISQTNAHGYLQTPRSRNLYAYQMGQMADSYEHTALNNNLLGLFSSSVCGQVQGGGRDFDFTRTGNQAAYTSGQTITVEAHLNVYHKGHFELSICSQADVNQDCFRNPANKLEFVRDNLYEAPIDAIHPYRAMIPPSSLGTYYSFDMKLPDNMENGNYVLKWMYVTANSCEPEGYDSYPFPSSWGSMTSDLPVCGYYEGETPPGVPEIFINCAEVSIGGGTPTPHTPTPPSPTPPTSSGTCGLGSRGNGVCEDGNCCSEFGWCGCSSSHCINGQSCSGPPPAPTPIPPAPTLPPPTPFTPSTGPCGGGNRGNGYCDDGLCCSEWGWCGCSSDHCIDGQFCRGPASVAPSPAPTFTGTCGGGSRGNGVCADGTCCSQWGWCGNSSEHCD